MVVTTQAGKLSGMVAAKDDATRADLQNQLNVVNGDGLDGFGTTLDSSEGGGQLADELSRRKDEP